MSPESLHVSLFKNNNIFQICSKKLSQGTSVQNMNSLATHLKMHRCQSHQIMKLKTLQVGYTELYK